MSFIRTKKRENPFVQLDKAFIGNGELSLKATGLLTYILSKPDGWQIRMKDIQKRFKDGETSVRSAMNELMKVGYVHRYRERREDGTLGDYIYEVYERPEYNQHFQPKSENHVQGDSPKRDFPELDNPEQENHVYSNNDFSNNDFSNKEEEEESIHIPDSLQVLIHTFKTSIGETNPVIVNKMKEWLNKLPLEVIKTEIENGALRGAKSWKYIETTLLEDLHLGVKTLNDIDNKIANFAAKKKKPTERKNSNGYKSNGRKEIVPKWVDEEDQEPPVVTNDIENRKKAVAEKLRKMNEKVVTK